MRKISKILIVFTALFVIIKVQTAIASHELTTCSDSTTFCQYQGMLGSLDEADKEFAMLLEPPSYPNFQSMYRIVSQMLKYLNASEEYLEALRDPECNVSKYIKKLLTYYETNKEEIEKNIKDNDSAQDLVVMFESIKKIAGSGFLRAMTLDNLHARIRKGCSSAYDKNKLKTNRLNLGSYCHGKSLFILVDLIDTVKELTEELDQLKRQCAQTSK